jgi:hypothetical protein
MSDRDARVVVVSLAVPAQGALGRQGRPQGVARSIQERGCGHLGEVMVLRLQPEQGHAAHARLGAERSCHRDR